MAFLSDFKIEFLDVNEESKVIEAVVEESSGKEYIFLDLEKNNPLENYDFDIPERANPIMSSLMINYELLMRLNGLIFVRNVDALKDGLKIEIDINTPLFSAREIQDAIEDLVRETIWDCRENMVVEIDRNDFQIPYYKTSLGDPNIYIFDVTELSNSIPIKDINDAFSNLTSLDFVEKVIQTGVNYQLLTLIDNKTLFDYTPSGSRNLTYVGMSLENYFKNMRIKVKTTFAQPTNQTTTNTYSSTSYVVPLSVIAEIDAKIEIAKKEISQSILMRSFVSPIDFEMRLKLNQNIEKAQEKLNDLHFKKKELEIVSEDIIDDLFEQSFLPLKQNFDNIYAPFVQERNQYESNDFFAPDGTPSPLSNEVNLLIRSKAFIEWFGNYQLAYNYRDVKDSEIPCSKVMSEHYEPLLVWHGTGRQFSYFRYDSFPAAYFAVNKNYSDWFAEMQGGDSGGYTIPFFLNVRNPLDLTRFRTNLVTPKEFFDYMFLMTGMDMEQLEINPVFTSGRTPAVETWVYLRNNPKMLEIISGLKVYDGIHFYETNPSVPVGEPAHSTEVFITFRPDQAKLADPDRGALLFGSMKSFFLEKGGKI